MIHVTHILVASEPDNAWTIRIFQPVCLTCGWAGWEVTNRAAAEADADNHVNEEDEEVWEDDDEDWRRR